MQEIIYLRFSASATPPAHFLLILSERWIHSNHVFWIFSTAEFLPLNRLKHVVRNNGLMGVDVEILIHATIIFGLRGANANSFLEQHPSGVFLLDNSLLSVSRFHLGLLAGETIFFVSSAESIFLDCSHGGSSRKSSG